MGKKVILSDADFADEAPKGGALLSDADFADDDYAQKDKKLRERLARQKGETARAKADAGIGEGSSSFDRSASVKATFADPSGLAGDTMSAANVLSRDMLNGASFGAYGQAQRRVAPGVAAQEDATEGSVPDFVRGTARATGGLTGGPAMAGAVGMRAAASLPAVARPLVAGAIGGGLTAGGEAATAGKSVGETLADAAKGASVGAAIGVGGQFAGAAARGVQRGMRSMSPQLKRYADARDSGFYETEEFKSIPGKGDERVQNAAERNRDRIVRTLEEGRATDNANYGEAKSQALASSPVAPREPIMQKLNELHGENMTAGGEWIDPQKTAALYELSDRFIEPHAKINRDIPVSDLLAMRQQVAERAEFGMPSTKENRPWRELYGTVRQMVHEASPAIAQADATLAAGKAKRGRINDVILGSDTDTLATGARPSAESLSPETVPEAALPAETPMMRAAKERTGAANVRFAGETGTKPGQARASQFEEVGRLDPQVRRALDNQRNVMAYESTRLTAEPLSGSASLSKLFGIPRFFVDNTRAAAAGLDTALNAGQGAADAGVLMGPAAMDFKAWLDARAADERERQRMLSEKVKGGRQGTSR